MNNIIKAAAVATFALAATSAYAGERKLFGPPSEPTIWGHHVAPAEPTVQTDEVRLERQSPAVSEQVRKASDRRARSNSRID
jgi:hypothetical protein